ncbi:expressed unknown protein [Seminavis robusta]|uniref:Uncharacterized protein n=1 Tax=Seminavis robusta TaxID=568900 RepID=A0A9N8HX98_9STRA|nr:expressed unknown protein [Seminavis robusta]|eukprot:Sro2423_g327230.1 n/a (276) ;mRNA; f:8015-8842
MAMELAVEMASNADCHCQQQESNNGTSTNNRLCQCRPVALLRVDSRVNTFPLRCHQQHHKQSSSDLTNAGNGTACMHGSRNTTAWTKQSLRKIQVHHALTLKSCLGFLLSLQGKPHNQQPYAALVIDDIDCLASSSGEKENNSSISHTVSQVLAILMDTLNFLHMPPAVICITMKNKDHKFLSTGFGASFFDGIVTLTDHSKASLATASVTSNFNTPFWNRICQANSVVKQGSSWTAQFTPNGSGFSDTGGKKRVEYLVVCNDSGNNHRIFWAWE